MKHTAISRSCRVMSVTLCLLSAFSSVRSIPALAQVVAAQAEHSADNLASQPGPGGPTLTVQVCCPGDPLLCAYADTDIALQRAYDMGCTPAPYNHSNECGSAGAGAPSSPPAGTECL